MLSGDHRLRDGLCAALKEDGESLWNHTRAGAVAVPGSLGSSRLAPMQPRAVSAAVSVLDGGNRGPGLQGCSEYGYPLALKIRFCCSQTSRFCKY